MSLPTDSKQRKATPIYSGVLKYFPRAIAAVAQCSQVGNDQHHPEKPLHWDKSKSTDNRDALVRHLLEAGTMDHDGVPHSAKVAWRALAALEVELENEPLPIHSHYWERVGDFDLKCVTCGKSAYLRPSKCTYY